ncbi:MAG: hypothetical protein RLZZ385_1536 [Pseudomonadota bacterium]|jgi:cephalosporin hydroxylase
MTSEADKFKQERQEGIRAMAEDESFKAAGRQWFERSIAHKYSYNFTWMGRPVIQYPQDIVAMQEVIWKVQPDLIIETGIAHGGSLILYASLLELVGGNGRVVGIDIDIRPHNREAIETHPMFRRITLIQGSSIAEDVVENVRSLAAGARRIMVVLDSNHTHDHVLAELHSYADLVSVGSYLVVFDTVVEDLPAALSGDRPWSPGNNPKTAVHRFLAEDDRFVIDTEIQDKLQLTVAPDGFLQRRR